MALFYIHEPTDMNEFARAAYGIYPNNISKGQTDK